MSIVKSVAAKHAVATFNPHDQTIEHVQAAVAAIINRGGCTRCGLIAVLSVEFQGDPPAELNKQGVVSYVETI